MCLTIKENKHFELQRKNKPVFSQPKSFLKPLQDPIEVLTCTLWKEGERHFGDLQTDFFKSFTECWHGVSENKLRPRKEILEKSSRIISRVHTVSKIVYGHIIQSRNIL